MNQSITSHILRQLVYTKGLYNKGVEHYSFDTEFDRAIAILHYDNTIEMLMNATIGHLGGNQSNERNFHALLDSLRKIIQKNGYDPNELIHESEIKNMRAARNLIQHQGIIPSASDLDRYTGLIETVFAKIVKNIFKLDVSEISLAILIKDDTLKTFFHEAEKNYTLKKYEQSLILSASAFEFAKIIEQSRLYGSGLLLAKSEMEKNKLINLLIDEIEVLKLRLDYKKYQKYRQIFGHCLNPNTELSSLEEDSSFKEESSTELSSFGKEKIVSEIEKKIKDARQYWITMESEELRKNTKFCLDFTLEAIFKWEAFFRKTWWED